MGAFLTRHFFLFGVEFQNWMLLAAAIVVVAIIIGTRTR